MDTNANDIMSAKPAQKSMVDMEKIVDRWAWNLFLENKTFSQRNIKFKQLNFNKDWSKVKFVHRDPDYTKVTQDIDPSLPPRQAAQVLFKTQFENKTGEDQNYSFKTERTTSSTCGVEVDKGVMMGVETSLTLKTPCEVLEVNAGFKREVTVNTTTSETVVDEVMWGVDSQIKVKGNHRTTAKLVVDEICEKDTYSIQSFMYGDIKVNITKKKNNKHITHIGGKIVDIVAETANTDEKKVLKVDKSNKEFPHAVVSYETVGKAIFKFGAEQRVELEEEPLS